MKMTSPRHRDPIHKQCWQRRRRCRGSPTLPASEPGLHKREPEFRRLVVHIVPIFISNQGIAWTQIQEAHQGNQGVAGVQGHPQFLSRPNLVCITVRPTMRIISNSFPPRHKVVAQLDDLCIDIWVSVMIMSQHPDNRETWYSNVLPRHSPQCRSSRSTPRTSPASAVSSESCQQDELNLTKIIISNTRCHRYDENTSTMRLKFFGPVWKVLGHNDGCTQLCSPGGFIHWLRIIVRHLAILVMMAKVLIKSCSPRG